MTREEFNTFWRCFVDDENKEIFKRQILELLSVQPERKRGHWIDKTVDHGENIIEEWQSAKCSACGRYHTTPYMYYFSDYRYCPSCGAKLEEAKG